MREYEKSIDILIYFGVQEISALQKTAGRKLGPLKYSWLAGSRQAPWTEACLTTAAQGRGGGGLMANVLWGLGQRRLAPPKDKVHRACRL